MLHNGFLNFYGTTSDIGHNVFAGLIEGQRFFNTQIGLKGASQLKKWIKQK